MFNSDKPITKIEDDVLNRGNFSKTASTCNPSLYQNG